MTDIVEELKQAAIDEVEILRKIGVDCQVTETNQWRCAVEIERLRASNGKMISALTEARLEIEYLQDKFQENGSGNGCIARISDALDNSQPETQYEKTKTPANREKS